MASLGKFISSFCSKPNLLSVALHRGISSSSYLFNHKVLLKGLPYDTTEDEVKEFLNPSVPSSIELQLDSTGRPSGNASVVFDDVESAESSLDKNYQFIRHRYVRVLMDSGDEHAMGNQDRRFERAPAPFQDDGRNFRPMQNYDQQYQNQPRAPYMQSRRPQGQFQDTGRNFDYQNQAPGSYTQSRRPEGQFQDTGRNFDYQNQAPGSYAQSRRPEFVPRQIGFSGDRSSGQQQLSSFMQTLELRLRFELLRLPFTSKTGYSIHVCNMGNSVTEEDVMRVFVAAKPSNMQAHLNAYGKILNVDFDVPDEASVDEAMRLDSLRLFSNNRYVFISQNYIPKSKHTVVMFGAPFSATKDDYKKFLEPYKPLQLVSFVYRNRRSRLGNVFVRADFATEKELKAVINEKHETKMQSANRSRLVHVQESTMGTADPRSIGRSTNLDRSRSNAAPTGEGLNLDVADSDSDDNDKKAEV